MLEGELCWQGCRVGGTEEWHLFTPEGEVLQADGTTQSFLQPPSLCTPRCWQRCPTMSFTLAQLATW